MRNKGHKRVVPEEERLLATATEGELEGAAAGLRFNVTLPAFEGPLDLLLHLIREHKLDILDIPISLITSRYLEYLDLMESLDIDVAAEFLVMAATLAHIKSRMLLPRAEKVAQDAPEEDGEDPRAALVRRLLEYQKYRDAGRTLGERPIRGRDLFLRPPPSDSDEEPREATALEEVSVFKLIEAFDKVLKSARIKLSHDVVVDRLSISETIHEVVERLQLLKQISFADLVVGAAGVTRGEDGSTPSIGRSRVLILFLALLEMAKHRLLRLLQEDATGEIQISLRADADASTLDSGDRDDYRN